VDIADEGVAPVDLIHRIGDICGLEQPLEAVPEPVLDPAEELGPASLGDGDIDSLVSGRIGKKAFDVAVGIVEVAPDGGQKKAAGGEDEGQS
jgi:hypothetical protein